MYTSPEKEADYRNTVDSHEGAPIRDGRRWLARIVSPHLDHPGLTCAEAQELLDHYREAMHVEVDDA